MKIMSVIEEGALEVQAIKGFFCKIDNSDY